MKLLITGATGLVGAELTALCKMKGIPVHYLTTNRNKVRTEEGLRGFYWDPSKGDIDLNCLEGVTHIINLAGASISSRWTKTHRKTILNSRVDSINTLRKALKEAENIQLTSIVSASAIGIYPHSMMELYTEKEKEQDPGFASQVVGKWEEAADSLKELGYPVAKVRIGLVLSDKGGALPKMAQPVKYLAGAAFGSGEQWQSWIHVRDLARMLLYVAENELDGIYNGVAPNPVKQNKLIKEIAKVMNKPLFLPNVPKLPMKILLGDMSSLLFSSQRVSSKRIESVGFEFQFQNICRALESLYQGEPKEVLA